MNILDNAVRDSKVLKILIKNEKGEIIYPKNVKDLKFCSNILALQNEEKEEYSACNLSEEEYYNKDTNKWYQIDEEKNGGLTTYYIFDITKYKLREKELEEDSLTKLPCRKETIARLNKYLEEIKEESNNTFSIIMADVDDFKGLNDTYGHDCGDKALIEISKIMKKHLRYGSGRKKDIIGRIGGDEFLIVMKNIDPDICKKRIEEIKTYIAKNNFFYSKKNNINLTMSFGIHSIDSEELSKIKDIDKYRSYIMKQADTALYRSKSDGKNSVRESRKKNNKDNNITRVRLI